jgi:uncharacterized protein YjbI with pentapeptide repeats
VSRTLVQDLHTRRTADKILPPVYCKTTCMANEVQLALIKQGVSHWNRWRAQNSFISPDLSGADLDDTNLEDADLEGANISGASFQRSVLIRAALSNANLSGANLDGSNLKDANLGSADLSGARFRRAILTGAILKSANVNRVFNGMAPLVENDLLDRTRSVDFLYANLDGADLSNSDLRMACFEEASLVKANLSNANFEGASFRLALLNGATMLNTRFNDVNFNHANFENSDLRSATLSMARFEGANFTSADLSHAALIGATMSRTICRDTKLNYASLAYSQFNEVNFHGTDLSSAELMYTVFAGSDLSKALGLSTCDHVARSFVDWHTLQVSEQLPVVFLRGVGLPESFIEYLPSFRSPAIQHYSCFISYSAIDQKFAEQLHFHLQENGVRCWFAAHDMPIGAKIIDAIDEAIRVRDKVLLILSENSISSSWVEDEVSKAFSEERIRGLPILFPIRLDNFIMQSSKPWACKLRDERNIGDFTGWQEDSRYRKSIERLLRDLTVAKT